MVGNNKDSELDKSLARSLARHTQNATYIKCTMDSLDAPDEKKRLITYLDESDGLSISQIEIEVMKITGLIRTDFNIENKD